MNMMAAFQGPASIKARAPLLTAISMCGLRSGLQMCLDAGDANSAPSATTKLLDVSGGGYDWFLGTTAAAQATDPTFTGNVDGNSNGEYFAFDGGDYFTYDTTNEAWMDNLHKNNATFTMMVWAYAVGNATPISHLIFDTNGTGAGATGCGMYWGASAKSLSFLVTNAGATVLSIGSGAEITWSSDGWYQFAMSLDEVNGNTLWQIDKDVVADGTSATYASPSAGASSFTARIGFDGGSDFWKSGTRLASEAIWNVPLTSAMMVALNYAQRGKFGK